MAVINPAELRKAAALVGALAELETKFDVRLNEDDPITFYLDGTTYATGRDEDGDLGLDLS